MYSAMDLQAKLLLYLDKRRFLLEMKNCCEDFGNQLSLDMIPKFPPLRYFFEVNIMDMMDFSPCLGKLLMEEPLKFQRFCNKILFACLKSMENINLEDVKSSQVTVTLRLKTIPPPLLNFNPQSYKGLVSFKGLLLEVTKPTPCVYHTVWSCPEECERNEVILHYIPNTPPKCYICKSVLFENSGLRRCGEKVTATFKIGDQLLPKKFSLTDDLFPKIKFGSVFFITAVILKKITEIWSLEVFVPLPAPVTMTIASDIDELFAACNGLPWKFIYCLASSIGVNVCPLNCFIHFKIHVLLSLISVKANILSGSSIIHILAAGFDTGLIGALMEEGRKLADVSSVLGNSNTTVANALNASSGGVCVLPLPLHIYNQRLTSAVFTAVESGEIVHDSGRIQLKAAIWAQGRDFKKINLYNVASVFATVCRGDYGEYEDEIAEFLLQRAVEPAKTTREEIQAMKDIAQYIDIVSGIQVSLGTATETLLRNYFLAARKEGTRGVSIGSMESLVATCLNSARLCHRTVATIDDAIFAIWLHVSGSPEPRFAPDEYLQTPADVKKLQKVFNQFIVWLEEFTGNCYTQH